MFLMVMLGLGDFHVKSHAAWNFAMGGVSGHDSGEFQGKSSHASTETAMGGVRDHDKDLSQGKILSLFGLL